MISFEEFLFFIFLVDMALQLSGKLSFEKTFYDALIITQIVNNKGHYHNLSYFIYFIAFNLYFFSHTIPY